MLDLNGTQAAIRAGYSKKTANPQAARLLAIVSIQENIQGLTAELGKSRDFGLENVLDGLQKIAANGRTDSARVRALELLGKHYGGFTDRLEVSQSEPAKVVLFWPHNGRDEPQTAAAKQPR
jgi:phage terminase small subunit